MSNGIYFARYHQTICMKSNHIIMLAIAICSSITLHAQKLDIGIKAGAEANKLEGLAFKESYSFGYHLGVFVRVGLTRKLSVQPEVLFSQTNIDTSNSFSDIYQFKDISKVKLGYLKIPLLLDYRIVPKVSIQAGPQYGILINNNLTLLQNGKDAFKKGEFSMLAGLQVNLLKFRIYGRYAIGLSELNDIDEKDKWKSQSVQLGVGLAF